MADPLIDAIKGGIGGFKEAISLADDLDGVVQQLGEVGKKELAARKAWRHKRMQVNGDYSFINAVDEYRRVKEALEMREEIRLETIARWGPAAWTEIETIEARQKEDYKKLFTEDGHDRDAMFRFKVVCFTLAGIVTFFLWYNCMLPMEILVSPNCR